MVSYSKTFRDVLVWQKAHAFVLDVYRVTESFPRSEIYGLSSQFRRAAVSIAANFAEGFKKRGKADKLRFYNIAQGSIEECQYYLILAADLRYADTRELQMKIDEVGRMLESYSAALATNCA
ncbi:MAG: four helix bundle protein [Verrucomicrobia bacterium]|nr:four helix bundle protein [Verrucomicrobiota bacterium]